MKILVLVHNGFEEAEMIAPVDIMRRAGAEAVICSMTGKRVLVGSRNINIEADIVMPKNPDIGKLSDEYCGVVIPGGGPNAFSMRDDDRAVSVVKEFYEKGKIVGAICAAPIVLEKAGIIKNKKVTSYTGMLNENECIYLEAAKSVRDGNIITSCGPCGCLDFGYALVNALYGEETEQKLKREMIY